MRNFSWSLEYYLLHPHVFIRDVYDSIKWFIQRGSRGYADCDVWSLDWYLTSFMPQALRDLKKQLHGTPVIDTGRILDSNDYNDIEALTIEEWSATLERLAQTFEAARKVQDLDYPYNEIEAAQERVKKGLDMFNEYFFSLWD